MVWVFPDRESSRALPYYDKAFWRAYEEVAAQLGLSWDRHPPEDVAVDAIGASPQVYVGGQLVTTADTLFVTSLYSLPYQAMDVFNQYATFTVLPDLRSVLWLGEAWDQQLDADLAAVAPQARRWGMFGSTETWVVATNTPDCPDDVWHPLPSQLVCVGEHQLLDFTCLSPRVLNPVLRYRTGDAGRLVDCGCGKPRPALQVLGRRDHLIKFRGHLLNVDDLVADLAAVPGVARTQLVVREAADGGSVLQVFQRNPHSLEVDVVESLIGNERTGKIPSLVVRPAG